MRTKLSIAMTAVLGALALAPSTAQAAPCYVAFIHGSGSNYSSSGSAEYWTPAWISQGVYGDGAAFQGCAYRLIGYDGTLEWWAGAALVAQQLNQFITEAAIPDRKLVIVTHSMGGLVARWILNNGNPNGSPYYNYAGADYGRIVAKTSHAITLQAPHFGTEVADMLWFDASSALAGKLLGLLGWALGERTNARSTMTRSYMEDAANWMGDAMRTRVLWTVAGVKPDGTDSGNGRLNDFKLRESASLLNLGPPNNEFYNDGLVEERSAHGKSVLKERKWIFNPLPNYAHVYSSERSMQGAFYRWFSTALNHEHGRYSDMQTWFMDWRSYQKTRNTLGKKIGLHGLDLPCSDPEVRPAFSPTGYCYRP